MNTRQVGVDVATAVACAEATHWTAVDGGVVSDFTVRDTSFNEAIAHCFNIGITSIIASITVASGCNVGSIGVDGHNIRVAIVGSF